MFSAPPAPSLIPALALSLLALGFAAPDQTPIKPLALTLRTKLDSPGLGGACRTSEREAAWNPSQTAVIVCDMWDLHHCLNATRRGLELAPRMDQVLKTLRSQGVTIIHAPSSCMDPYTNHPARLRAQATKRSKSLPPLIADWCKQIPSEEASAYPIDQRDGGEDDDPAEHARWQARLAALGRNPAAPWKSQTDVITIDSTRDYISDNGEEIWSILETRGLDNVILMGVHLNMCVLGRPFGLRQMAKNGKNVVLMRDMTDTMYNPLKAPFVSHFSGTDRMIDHVERFVCPTIASNQFLGGKPFRFKGDKRPHVVFLIGEDEYHTETTLPSFAAAHLAKDTKISYIFDSPTDKNDFPGLHLLDDADLILVSVRRRLLPNDQLALIRRFVASGKPVVAIRTASHAFAPRNQSIPEGHSAWTEFDADILGGHYVGHHGPSAVLPVSLVPQQSTHPILKDVDLSHLKLRASLYKVTPLAPSATPLLTAQFDNLPPEPVLWTNLTPSAARVVYTSLGAPENFSQPPFQRLLRNAIDYSLNRPPSVNFNLAFIEPIPFPN